MSSAVVRPKQPVTKIQPRRLQTGVIYHPVHGYPIPPPVPVAVARRNQRERSRVKTVNDSYQCLKAHVPAAARTKRMSKVDIIRHSIEYITRLQAMVDTEHAEPPCFAPYYPHYPAPEVSSPASTPGSCGSVPVSPAFSVTSSSSSISSSMSSPLSMVSPTPLPPAPAQPSYSPGDSLLDHLDEDILDVIAEWQDS